MTKIDDAGSPVVDVAYKTAAAKTRVMPWNDLDPLAVAWQSIPGIPLVSRTTQLLGHVLVRYRGQIGRLRVIARAIAAVDG
jgi:hypothetical protein